MPSAVQPNGRYSLKLLNTIAKIPKLCPNIMRLFSLNNWLNDKIQIAKELIFLLEMLKTSLLGKCLIYFNQIFSDFEGKYFFNFWTELGNF